MSEEAAVKSDVRPLWVGAAITAVAAGLFPRLNAVIHENVPIWRLDPEARVLLPLVVALPLLLFGFLGRWAWAESGGRNRPARVGLVCGVVGVVGFIAFFLSLPIALGGLAPTLGLEGKARASKEGRARHATAAIVLGIMAAAGGAAVWLLAGSI